MEDLRTNSYPSRVTGKEEKVNSRRTSKRFSIEDEMASYITRRIGLFGTRSDNETLYMIPTKGKLKHVYFSRLAGWLV